MENLTYNLKSPVVMDGMTYDHLTLNELTVDEMVAFNKSHGTKTLMEQDKFYFAMMCQVSPDVIGKLKQRDWNGLRKHYKDTLGNDEQDSETLDY